MNFFKIIFKKIIGNFKIFNNKIIKFGIDPTYYSIHLGHFYIINFIFFLLKKKFFIIFIIGDFTTLLKKKITKNKIIINSICLKSQLFNLIGDIIIYYNSIFVFKKKIIYFLKIINILNINKYICKNINDLKKKTLYINNIVYPVFQAFDSLIINAFIEIGGVDQLLNIFCGRFIQKIFNKNKQNSILFFILEKNNIKISKSNKFFFLNNFFLDIFLFKKIFYNLNIYIKQMKKYNNFIINYYKIKFYFNIKKNFFFKKKNYLSVYFKKIFLNNKNFFYKLIYNNKIIINNKLLIKNFFLTKKQYKIDNYFLINFYD
ncbi:hypothetical protein ACJEC8_00835 [Candidatus Carsonella ruddii]|uniref:hypothetical protein n=1 Tax=Carsonella ruddii TaxID=114186 RepID=UPI003D4C427C